MAVLTAVAPVRSSFIAPKVISGKVTIRKSVYALSDTEVQRYRLAVYRIAKISAEAVHDHRGFQFVAGIHGLPGRYCKHHVPAFAIWHRPYVQRYEQLLQDAVPDAFVPYWDWTTHTAQSEGIPAIFTQPTWSNPDTKKTEPNPLLSQPKSLIGRGPTTRDPNPAAGLAPLRGLVHTALLAQDYPAFSPDLENPHDQLHGWCGGDMGLVATAAYDPLFWSHHAFVEYVFCQWQDSHPEALPPQIDPRLFAPFSVTVDEVWNYHKLGYAYEPDNASDLRIAGVNHGPGANASNALRSGATVAHFPLHTLDPDFSRADVKFEGLTPPEDTLAVHVFADQPKATPKDAVESNGHYLGTRYFFGHGECGGAEGHCDPIPRDIFDLREPHHYDPVQVRLNVTRRLKDLIMRKAPRTNEAGDAPVTLVVVDRKGEEIKEPTLHFEGLSVVVR